jgi:hypothetical protein
MTNLTKESISQILECIEKLIGGLQVFKDDFMLGKYSSMDQIHEEIEKIINKGINNLDERPTFLHDQSQNIEYETKIKNLEREIELLNN